MPTEMKITLSRDSVCMADDVFDHTKAIGAALVDNPQAFIIKTAKEYLPRINGVGHSWNCILDGKSIAVVRGNCVEFAFGTNSPALANGSKLHFQYHSATY